MSETTAATTPRTTRHFIGVTEKGLRIAIALTGEWMPDAEYRPIPMSALRGEDPVGRVCNHVVKPDEGTTLWPVDEAVYRDWNDDDTGDDGYDSLPNGEWNDDDEDDL